MPRTLQVRLCRPTQEAREEMAKQVLEDAQWTPKAYRLLPTLPDPFRDQIRKQDRPRNGNLAR
eukprot:5996338-Amphidinium_carterae.1